MHNRFVLRNSLLLLSAICLALAIQNSGGRHQNNVAEEESSHKENEALRIRRATRRPGFFKTLFSVIFEQFRDSRNTFRNVSRLVNNNFLPENAPVTVATVAKNEPNVSTTPAPYRITRSEFYKILRRNLKGLIRLYNIELQDALKQSEKYRKEFRKNTSMEVSKFL